MTGRVEWLAMQPKDGPRIGYARQDWRTLRVTVKTQADPFVGDRPVVRAMPIGALPGKRALRPCGPYTCRDDILVEQVDTLVSDLLAEPTREAVA